MKKKYVTPEMEEMEVEKLSLLESTPEGEGTGGPSGGQGY